MPGRYFGFSLRVLIASTVAWSRPQIDVSRPARRATEANAVPQDPAPITQIFA
jgi:hypothetical protein